MSTYIGILLTKNTEEHLSYFKNNLQNYFQYYQSYEQMLMQCDCECRYLLIPFTFQDRVDVMQYADSLQLEIYLYNFVDSTCQFYKLAHTELSSLLQESQKGILNLRQKKQQIRISMYDIRYIESNRNYIIIYTIHNTIRLRMQLSKLQSQLDTSYFMRCHQSYIINMRYVYSMQRYEVIMMDGASIPISKTYTKETRAFYKQLFINR